MSLTPAEKAMNPEAVFRLDPQLARDSLPICMLGLCEVRLMNNRHFPWTLLVPQAANTFEIIDLSDAQRHRLMDEIAQVSDAMRKLYQPAKLNIAALGNQVAQLHVHVIARMIDDAAWPQPVWGGASAPYETDALEAGLQSLRAVLGQPYAAMA